MGIQLMLKEVSIESHIDPDLICSIFAILSVYSSSRRVAKVQMMVNSPFSTRFWNIPPIDPHSRSHFKLRSVCEFTVSVPFFVRYRINFRKRYHSTRQVLYSL
jgi:hypothetical protein